VPVPDEVQDDGSGIQNPPNFLDTGFRRYDGNTKEMTFCGFINLSEIQQDDRKI
jgi:hypothetical protein